MALALSMQMVQVLYGIKQRSGSCVVAVIDVEAVADREVDAVDVACSHCIMEDQRPIVVAAHEIGAMLKGGVSGVEGCSKKDHLLFLVLFYNKE